MTISKLGVHALRPTKDAKRILNAGSKVVKMVGNFGLENEIDTNQILVIGREVSIWPNQNGRVITGESMRHLDSNLAAEIFINLQKNTYLKNPKIKIWEGVNEPIWNNIEDMAWYSAFEVKRLQLLAEMNLKGVIGNFSTGNPDLSWWSYFAPAVREAILLDGYLGLHEYTSPYMWWMTGKYQLKQGETAGNEGWTTLRYRKVIKELAKIGVIDFKILITECGLDHVSQVLPGMSSGNWRVNSGWWTSQSGADDPIDYWRETEKDAGKYYAEQLIWYDKELLKDEQVKGATIFTFGSDNSAWDGYDVQGTTVVDRLVDYLEHNDNPIPEPSPEPIPESENIKDKLLKSIQNLTDDTKLLKQSIDQL